MLLELGGGTFVVGFFFSFVEGFYLFGAVKILLFEKFPLLCLRIGMEALYFSSHGITGNL